jgi:hypothetical protein
MDDLPSIDHMLEAGMSIPQALAFLKQLPFYLAGFSRVSCVSSGSISLCKMASLSQPR